MEKSKNPVIPKKVNVEKKKEIFQTLVPKLEIVLYFNFSNLNTVGRSVKIVLNSCIPLPQKISCHS
jgi:hypothetical protein